ncbi:MAG TPA: DNA-3-methyladenine glycosylase I, partial [Urbifossiella sp.]|nr:DNA-3-methyladenine glycosylase I [Urbifossiella sp.]
IIRSRAKIEAAVGSARAYLAMAAGGEDFSTFCWELAGNTPAVNVWTAMSQVPAKTPRSEQISKALKARGFKFVGPVIVYAWMQAVGMVNDHLVGCARQGVIRLP